MHGRVVQHWDARVCKKAVAPLCGVRERVNCKRGVEQGSRKVKKPKC